MNKNNKKSISSIKSSKTPPIVILKNTEQLKPSSSSSVKLPKKRVLPIKKAKQLYQGTSSSSSPLLVKLPKKRVLPIKKAKRYYMDTSSSSSSTFII